MQHVRHPSPSSTPLSFSSKTDLRAAERLLEDRLYAQRNGNDVGSCAGVMRAKANPTPLSPKESDRPPKPTSARHSSSCLSARVSGSSSLAHSFKAASISSSSGAASVAFRSEIAALAGSAMTWLVEIVAKGTVSPEAVYTCAKMSALEPYMAA